MADDNRVLFGILGTLIIGAYGWLIKHITTKHPSSDKVVFRDTCQANRDCMETKIDGLKELVETRFDNLEELIKNV